MFQLIVLAEKARRFVIEEGEDEVDGCEYDVDGGGDNPAVVGHFVDVKRGALVGEVGEHDADVEQNMCQPGLHTIVKDVHQFESSDRAVQFQGPFALLELSN